MPELDGDLLLVGARGYCAAGAEHGCENGLAYLYERNRGGPGNWGLVKRLESDAAKKAENDSFGRQVFISGDLILVQGDDASAFFEFGRDVGGADNWDLRQKFTIPGSQANSAFDGNRALVTSTKPTTSFLLQRQVAPDSWNIVARMGSAG